MALIRPAARNTQCACEGSRHRHGRVMRARDRRCNFSARRATCVEKRRLFIRVASAGTPSKYMSSLVSNRAGEMFGSEDRTSTARKVIERLSRERRCDAGSETGASLLALSLSPARTDRKTFAVRNMMKHEIRRLAQRARRSVARLASLLREWLRTIC